MNRQQARHPERHNVSVCIGITTAGDIAAETHASITGTMMRHPGLISGEIVEIAGPRVAENRNAIIKKFFSDPGLQDTEWLLFIDADMAFDTDAISQLLADAHPELRPIVGGLCFAGRRGNPIVPTLWRLDEEGDYQRILEYPEGVIKLDATGAAFLLVHQLALRKIGTVFAKLPNGIPSAYPWMVEGVTTKTGEALGEDVAFCARANVCGIPIHVDTRVKCGHIKSHNVNEALYLAQKESVSV